MNDPESSPINLDELRLMPDWLKEESPSPSKQYASHDYPTDDRSARGRDGGRPGGGGFGRGGDRRDARGGSGGGGPGRGGPPSDRRRDDRRSGPGARPGGGRPFRDERGAGGPPPAPPTPAPVTVEFLPDERCLVSINKQIRSTHLAYPLFGLARMFLQEPERHVVEFTLTPEAVAAGQTLYQLGEDGPITLDKQTLEKIAFDASKEKFYVEETVQKEPLKGNFTNVARERQSGVLLGPTNYHGYQPALRALYDSRYSRRMSFEDFRRNIEVSSDPALVERWKEEARTATTISTREETPTVLQSLAEARQHFRQHYFEGLLRTGTRLSVHGSVARRLPEPAMMQAIRESHERELRYPAQFVQLLRQGLQNAGLHIFKHRKRVVYVSLARPTPFVAHGAVSPNVSAILETIAQSPLCTRKALAERVLAKSQGEQPNSKPEVATASAPAVETEVSPEATATTETSVAASSEVPPETAAAPETTAVTEAAISAEAAPVESPTAPAAEDPLARAKAALAADLRFLVQSGHIIEFHNGTFDLPLPPKTKEELAAARPAGKAAARQTSGAKPAESAAPAESQENQGSMTDAGTPEGPATEGSAVEADATSTEPTEEPSDVTADEPVSPEASVESAAAPEESSAAESVGTAADAEARHPVEVHTENVEKPVESAQP